ncbi:MAG: PAS domain-containing protein [Candidatus Firestonebacteria bacterium]|nr:PAS domain-containing protein [Candidatus Firestonebacteria bacterium]
MRKPKLRGLLFGAFLLLLLGFSGAFLGIAVETFTKFYYVETIHNLEIKAGLVTREVAPLLAQKNHPGLEDFCRALAKTAGARITLILPTGQVLADSEDDPALMENHADRPEVMGALAGSVSTAERFSYTLHQNMLYLALPHSLPLPSATTVVIRLAIPTTTMSRSLHHLYWRFGILTVLILMFGAAYGLWMAQKISRPLEDMRRQAARFAQGELDQKIAPVGLEEINSLAESLNLMAAQWHERIQAHVRKQQEQTAILTSMEEGVIAVDRAGQILEINQAARKFLNLDNPGVRGRVLAEVVRNSQLQAILTRTLSGSTTVSGELIIPGEPERFLQVQASVLRDAQGQDQGAVLVLNDLTHLRRLENLRREFVANVSHELKTPITAIQGFVETLQEGALKNPVDAKHFLQIIEQQSRRLNTIIEDLLSLSRIEQEAEKASLALTVALLQPVLGSALALCQPAAAAKKITLELACPGTLQLPMNDRLLEQAVVNYLNNAIAYSGARTTVRLEGEMIGSEIAIRVADQGPGIAAEHLPRLFERFYRVDKSRSREAGGSGLGLAIVKHIVQAHGGRVGVESVVGSGSVFSLYLPANR